MNLGQVWCAVRGRSLAENSDNLISASINEEWDGLSDTAPIRGLIVFDASSSSGLSGTALYTVTVRGVGEVTAKINVQLPRQVIVDVITLLEGTEIEGKEYRPTFTHTDDYPKIEVEFRFGSDVVILGSRSQGKKRIPWEVTWGEKKWVSDSDHISTAMEILRTYSQHDVRTRLIEFASTLSTSEDDIPF